MRLPLLLATAASVAMLLLPPATFAQQNTRGSAYRRAVVRANAAPDTFSEVTFSDTEDDFMRSKQREAATAIAGYLPGKSAHHVLRRCVELGLPCGAAAPKPERGSEPWRSSTRRQQQRK